MTTSMTAHEAWTGRPYTSNERGHWFRRHVDHLKAWAARQIDGLMDWLDTPGDGIVALEREPSLPTVSDEVGPKLRRPVGWL